MENNYSKNKEENENNNDNWMSICLRWMGVGIEFVLVVGGLSLLGNLLDKKIDTSPGFMIMGFFIGFFTMLNIMIKRAGGIKWK